jgi:NitT/TauT family transport system substrate-binding protein
MFDSGSDAGVAMLAGEIDATYIGPGPAQQLFLRSGKVALVSGAVVGGAGLVVAEDAGIDEPADLSGRRVAVPSIGNSQDIALRTWLHDHGLEAADEGGTVRILPVRSEELDQLFRTGQIDAAWEPEPWSTLLVDQGLATRLVDEATLWPDGRFVTASLAVSTGYLDAHPEVVERLVRANVESIELLRTDPDRARALLVDRLKGAGVPRLTPALVEEAWPSLGFDWDPQVDAFLTQAEHARALGYLDGEPSAILRIYRLDVLNHVLEEMGLPTVPVRNLAP